MIFDLMECVMCVSVMTSILIIPMGILEMIDNKRKSKKAPGRRRVKKAKISKSEFNEMYNIIVDKNKVA